VDYSVNYYPPLNLLIANIKYVGDDFGKDLMAFGENEEVQKFSKLFSGMWESFNDGAPSPDDPGLWTVSFNVNWDCFV
jgi:hypothetical protein